MAINDYKSIAQKFYVAYFGRPADAVGLQNMATALSNASAPTNTLDFVASYEAIPTVKAIIDSFGLSAESMALYTGDTVSFVTSIYKNVLGRAPDTEGLGFWVTAIDHGGLVRGKVALNIMGAAETNMTPQGRLDAALVARKIEIASYFTESITTPEMVGGYAGNAAAAAARNLISTVGAATDPVVVQGGVKSLLSDMAAGTMLSAVDLATEDDTGLSSTDNITQLSSGLTIRGIATTGASVSIHDEKSGLTLGSAIASDKGFSIDIALPEGSASLYAKVVNGGKSKTEFFNITVDKTAPAAPVPTLETDSGIPGDLYSNSIKITSATFEPNATIYYSTDGSIYKTGFTPVQGSNTVLVRQRDVAGNMSAASQKFTFYFDNVAPKLASNLPGVGETQVAVDSRIVLAFNEAVSAGTGNVVISDGGSDVRSISVQDATQITFDGSRLIIHPLASLAEDRKYHVTVQPGAVKDKAANDFAGLATANALSFTTGKYIPPTVIGVSDLDSAQGAQLAGAQASRIVQVPGLGSTTSGGELLGWDVSSAGDFNGDGFDDVILTSSTGSAGATAYVVYGTPTGMPQISSVAQLDGTNGFQIPSHSMFLTVRAAGDINGDGLGDLITATPANSSYDSSSGTGTIIFGQRSGMPGTFQMNTINGANGYGFSGPVSLGTGGIVNSAGDINGDGFDDVVISASLPGTGVTGTMFPKQIGGSYVLFGKGAAPFSPAFLSHVNGSGGFRLSAGEDIYLYGVDVSSVGDVNADGYDDFAIGISGSAILGNSSGSSYVVFGKAGAWTDLNLRELNGVTGFRLNAESASDSMSKVSAAGDINGDGYADLLVADAKSSTYGTGSGSTYVVFGKAHGFPAQSNLSALDGSNGFRLDGNQIGDGAGGSIAAAGDVNGDGYDDLIIGVKGADLHGKDSGSAYIVFGKGTPFNAAIALSSLNATNSVRIDGAGAGNTAGMSVSSAGDVNGDGFADVVVGAPYASNNAGSAYVVYGRDFTGAVEFAGSNAADSLAGSSAAESFVAGQGDDLMMGGGGADVFYGGAGNDIAVLADLGFRRIDGGSGNDVVRLDGAGFFFNLSDYRNRIEGIETIDLTGSGNNALMLAAMDVLNLSNTTNTLHVEGNFGDSIQVDSGWTDLGVAGGKHSYSQGAAILIVGTAVQVLGLG